MTFNADSVSDCDISSQMPELRVAQSIYRTGKANAIVIVIDSLAIERACLESSAISASGDASIEKEVRADQRGGPKCCRDYLIGSTLACEPCHSSLRSY